MSRSATATTPVGQATAAPMYFEDFGVGQRLTSAERTVTERDLRLFTEVSGDSHPLHTDAGHASAQGFDGPLLHGPFGFSVVVGLFGQLVAVEDTLIAMLDTHWRYLHPIHVGDTVHFVMTVTRCRRTSDGDRGVVNRHVRLFNQHGQPVQEGSTAMLIRARETGEPGGGPAGRAFATAAWGQALVGKLDDDERFASATATWDGTIGLRCGDDEVHLRIYRGRVVEASRRAPLGATFTIESDELTWTELLTGPRNDFTRRAMDGGFTVRGSGYDYLRLTKAVTVLVDCARNLAAEETR